MVLLGAHTLSQGYLVGLFASFFQADEIVYAIGIISGSVCALAVYASITKKDFTKWEIYSSSEQT